MQPDQVVSRSLKLKHPTRQRAQQLLGRDGGTAVVRIQSCELLVQRRQGFVRMLTDQPQRMGVRDPVLWPDIAEKPVTSFIPTAHPRAPQPVNPMTYRIRYARVAARGFSPAC